MRVPGIICASFVVLLVLPGVVEATVDVQFAVPATFEGDWVLSRGTRLLLVDLDGSSQHSIDLTGVSNSHWINHTHVAYFGWQAVTGPWEMPLVRSASDAQPSPATMDLEFGGMGPASLFVEAEEIR